MTNGLRKVRKGGDIFEKIILDSFKFILDSASFPRSWQSINQYHGARCTIYQDSTLYVSIILVSGKRVGEDREGETLPSLHYYFLFFSQEGCILPCYSTQILFSHKKLETMTVLSFLDAYT